MSLDKFKSDIKAKFRDGFENGTRFLKSQGLKDGIGIYNEFLLCESRFIKNEKDLKGGLLSRYEYDVARTKILSSVLNAIDSIEITDLETDFLTDKEETISENAPSSTGENSNDNLNNTFDSEYKKTTNDIDNLRSDKQITLEKIINEKILIPTDSFILNRSPLDKHDFVKRLMQCQEYFSLEDYFKAYKECEYIKNNLEPKSAQLYEFFFISYFKIKGGEDSIIQDIENNKFDTITNLELYSKRCKEFNKEFNSTTTAENNIEIICRRLSYSLKERYLAINYNYINLGDNLDIRKKIEKYINCGIDIVTEININKNLITSFLELALNELNGGGRLDWINVSSDWKLSNKMGDYDAIKKREQIEAIVKKNEKLELTKKRTYRNLGTKYSNIKFNRDNSNLLGVTEATIKFIKTSILCFKFYNDNKFLELALEELKGKGRVNWYDLDENDKIISSKNANAFNYSPYNDLNRMIPKFEEKEAEKVLSQTIEEIRDYLKRQRYLESLNQKIIQIDKQYEEIVIVPMEDGEIQNDLENRIKIIECINLWMEMFEESRDQDKTLHKCIKELSGEGKVLWFKAEFVDNKNFSIFNHQNTEILNYDAGKYLIEYCKKSSIYSPEDKILELKNTIHKKIAEKLIYVANTKYKSI
jgi:hypothetical protein